MQKSESTPETASNPSETTEPTETAIDQVAALLRGEDADQSDAETQDKGTDADESSAASSETDDKKREPKNLAELAETLGVKVSDLYKIEVPFDVDGESKPRTLGEIKDAIAQRDDFEVDRLAWEEQRTERENDLARSMQELNEIVGMLPKSAISDDLLKAVGRKRAETVERESRLTRQVIPEWQDEDAEERDRVAMRDHLQKYGFPKNYLDGIVDHRTLRYIRESMRREQRIERALAQVKTVRKPGISPSSKPSRPAPQTPKRGRASRQRNQVAQVAELLRSN